MRLPKLRLGPLPRIPLIPVRTSTHDPVEPPIRAELFGIERLEQHAASLAAAQAVVEGSMAGRALLTRVDDNGRALREAHQSIAQAMDEDHWITPAAEWLLDNFFVVDEQLREIRDDLPAQFYRELPKLAEGALAGYPRVYGIAWAFVAHTDSRFDPETLRRFVLAYQRVQPLTIGELWAVAITLRVVLVENLRRIADALVRGRAAREEADAFADDLLGSDERGLRSAAAVMRQTGGAPMATAFAVELVQRLRDQDPAVTPGLGWLRRRLVEQGTTPDEIAMVEHRRQAAMTVTVRNIITSMRLMSALDWTTFFESVSLVDEVLRSSEHFAAMDFQSRDSYRHAVEHLARGARRTELDIARTVVAEADSAQAHLVDDDVRRADPGYYLVGGGRRAFERKIHFRPTWKLRLERAFIDAATPGYLLTLLVMTAVVLAVPLHYAVREGVQGTALLLLGLLAAIPASDLAIALLNRAVTSLVSPQLPPRLEFRDGVPASARTMVVVPTLLSSRDDVIEEIDRLEVHFLANAEGDVRFALLSDWTDAVSEQVAGDEDILAAARAGIAELNTRYEAAPDGTPRFLLYHRRRLWNARQGAWMGWERKRGKLHELNRLLRGATDTTFMPGPDGTVATPTDVRFIVTLDTDTRLPIGVVRRLAGTLAHPLNRPHIDPVTRHVVDGYSILQPRVTPPLPGRTGSRFQQLLSGSAGVDPYAAAVSDVYQDLFNEGSYAGKGIYDIDAFERSLDGRVPENALLSHDLFESIFARACLVTDAEFFEAAPLRYSTAAARQHRWTRGDWQLLPWILREPMTLIERWKLLDNLRRSLSMPTALLTLVAGWALAQGSPLLWTTFVLAVIAIPAVLPALIGMVPRAPGISTRSHLRAVARDFAVAGRQSLFVLTMMAHQAWVMADAIVRTLWRVVFSHRRMLEWVSAASAASRAPTSLVALYRGMVGAVILSAVAAVAVTLRHPAALPVALPFLVLWALSPAIAGWLSRTGTTVIVATLSADDALTLRLIARRTWRYFTTFVTPESGALPPDNFQETPEPVVAQRTSPTNIGMYLLSAVAAHDFGWIGTDDLVDRLDATLRRMSTLEQHRGHLYNWYDTQDGRALEPRYVSSVDSGNLAGALITMANACVEITEQPLVRISALRGIEDAARLLRRTAHQEDASRQVGSPEVHRLDEALDVLMAVLRQPAYTAGEWADRLAELESATHSAASLARATTPAGGDGGTTEVAAWAQALRDAIETHARDLESLMPWARVRGGSEGTTAAMASLNGLPSLAELASHSDAALALLARLRDADGQHVLAGNNEQRTVDALTAAIESGGAAAATITERLLRLAAEARAMVASMEFGFLFDPVRKLFAIGYRISDGTLDAGRYDLLASEARILSFIAIAKGDVPVVHWFRLGRSLTPVGTDSVLLSWSGSMFEYLMPNLIMRSPVGGLLEQTCRLVVQRQIEFGKTRSMPWGISESGYNVRNLEMTYQYSNFGVPGLGLRRGLADDSVVAPYATGLATMIDPVASVANFRTLSQAGADGPYGFYESLDYTASRLPAGSDHAVVRMYMAHHQGMLMVAVANALNRGAMRRRFHAEPAMCATELLLQERTPRDVAVARPRSDALTAASEVRELVPPHTRRFLSPHGATPRTHLLSNGRYAVMLTAAGAGYSRWRDLAVTRWRDDVTLDNTGSFIYLRDVATGDFWSAGFQPTGVTPASYEAAFSEDRAEIVRRDGAITTRLEVIVSSEDDAELRRVSVTNSGARTREIEVTSYGELILAPPAADAAHPAFSNLFVQTESIADQDTLLATRRPRSPEEAEVWLAHVVAVEGETIGDLEWETDRAQFLGRGATVRAPDAIISGRSLGNTVGSVLDPIISLRRRIRIRPGKTVRVAFSTLIGASRAAVLDLADKYHDVTTFERAATLAWTQAQVQLHHLGIAPDEADLFQTLGASILYADRAPRAPAEVLMRQTEGAAALWAHGISGDLPIVLVQIDDADDIGLVRQLLRAHEYWRMKRLAVDLVILNDRAPSYVQDLQTLIETLVRTSQAMPRHAGDDARGQVFVLRADHVSSSQSDVLLAAARVALSNRRGTLAAQVSRANRFEPVAVAAPLRVASAEIAVPAVARPRPALEFFNGLGGFAENGREYVTILDGRLTTPAPWVNVLANATFGSLVSDSGAGCTWSVNSQENQLTPWSNDPVCDPPSDMFYVRDDDNGDVWSPTPLPIRENNSEYVVRHGQGYTRFHYNAHEMVHDLLHFVPTDDPVKVVRLTLINRSLRSRHLTVTGYLEWVLGVSRGGTSPYIITEMDEATGAMLARNSWSRDFSGRIAFADLGGAQTAWTADRTEFLGRNGSTDRPASLVRRARLSGRHGAALDPCCALQTAIELPPGGRQTVVLVIGQAANRDDVRALVQRYRATDLDAKLAEVVAQWDSVLGAVQVQTPDRALDLLLNRWLLYQTLASRIWARTAFYQASGAYGFRDQLQDVLALMVAWPEVGRNQLLRAAARQFVEGDVQHWWHEPVGRGVRTRISDDLLWLPFVAKHYLDVTEDQAILDATVPFLDGPLLAPGQNESYFEPRVAAEAATLFEHCARAIDRSLGVGEHGLPLIGTGDWNDGMNRVGVEGKGESVWLAWFLYTVLEAWAPIATARGEHGRAEAWRTHSASLRVACSIAGWDGDWYRRAYFDDGTPLGSKANMECTIDSIAQSWSVLSGAADEDRARQAMASVDQRLVRHEDRLILLLTPPFNATTLQPGYIKGYVPGVRENGGQYTHAAAWVALAFARLGNGDQVGALLNMLNPVTHSDSPAAAQLYKVEPYVIAGDVYGAAPHVGRGGWTWYTGSAGWVYRAGIEGLLGFRIRGATLSIAPCIPTAWPGFTVTYRYRTSTYRIVVENPSHVSTGVTHAELDGIRVEDPSSIALHDDGATHELRVVLG